MSLEQHGFNRTHKPDLGLRSLAVAVATPGEDLADMLSAVADGGIILSRVIHDKNILPRQVMLYREFIKALFIGQ